MSNPHYAPPAAPIARNGLGLASVIVAPIGILFGLVPLTGFLAVIAGLVAVPLGLAGRKRYKNHQATNGKTATTGLLIGLAALALGVWGIVITFQATNQLAEDLGADVVESEQSASATAAAFGERFTFDNGLAVEVSAPAPFHPSIYAHITGEERDRAVTVEITVINGSDAAVDGFLTSVSATHDGRSAPQVIDPEKDILGPPDGKILPGNSITFPVAFSIGENLAELQLDIIPALLGDAAVFLGQA